MDREAGLAAVVARTFGLGDAAGVKPLGSGQFCVAMLIEPDLVVRFPRHAAGVKSVRDERALMPIIGPHVQVALPEPEQAELDLPIGQAFAAHRLVPGRILTRTTLDELGDEDFREVGAQLSAFLADLAALATPVLAAGGIEQTLAEMADDLSADVERLLGDRLSATQRDRAEREIDGVSRAGSGRRALCHTDLGGNLVWDVDQRRLGVIDFGGAIVSDPVLDLASIAALGDRLASAVGREVEHLADRGPHAGAIRATFVLQDALNEARQGNWVSVDEILDDY